MKILIVEMLAVLALTTVISMGVVYLLLFLRETSQALRSRMFPKKPKPFVPIPGAIYSLGPGDFRIFDPVTGWEKTEIGGKEPCEK